MGSMELASRASVSTASPRRSARSADSSFLSWRASSAEDPRALRKISAPARLASIARRSLRKKCSSKRISQASGCPPLCEQMTKRTMIDRSKNSNSLMKRKDSHRELTLLSLRSSSFIPCSLRRSATLAPRTDPVRRNREGGDRDESEVIRARVTRERPCRTLFVRNLKVRFVPFILLRLPLI